MHPGDALFTPGEPVDVLATPAAAPWMKISEAVDYLRAVAPTPRRAHPPGDHRAERPRHLLRPAIRDDRHRLPGARRKTALNSDSRLGRGLLDVARRGTARRPAGEHAATEERALQRAVAVHTAAAETRGLTRGVQPVEHAAVGLSTRESRSVSKPPNDLRVRMCSLTAISGPAFGSVSRCGATTRLTRSPR